MTYGIRLTQNTCKANICNTNSILRFQIHLIDRPKNGHKSQQYSYYTLVARGTKGPENEMSKKKRPQNESSREQIVQCILGTQHLGNDKSISPRDTVFKLTAGYK